MLRPAAREGASPATCSAAVSPPAASRKQRFRRWTARNRRLIRNFLAVLALASALVATSYARALLRPDSPGWRLRSAEWVRDNHLGWALDLGEWCWFSIRRSRVNDLKRVELSTFPAPFERRVRRRHIPRAEEPAAITTLFATPLPGEGIWRDAGWLVNHMATLRCTSFRPDTEHPKVVVGVARFTPALTRFVLVPGTQDPGGEWDWHGVIPKTERDRLLSAFNSGFRLNEAQGGFYAEGKLVKPLVAEAASLVIDQKGNVDIIAWGSERAVSPDVASVRQNLRLIVDKGEVVPGLARNQKGMWGFKLNQGLYTWRSGLGIAEDNALIYIAGDGLTLTSLAAALKHAGAVRAMELDIHDVWSTFNIYQPARGPSALLVATKLLPAMPRPAERYLTPDDRDFIAAFVR